MMMYFKVFDSFRRRGSITRGRERERANQQRLLLYYCTTGGAVDGWVWANCGMAVDTRWRVLISQHD